MEGFLFCFSLILTLGPLQGCHVSTCVQRNFQLRFVTRSSFGKEATSRQCGPSTTGGTCHQPNPKQRAWSGPWEAGSPGWAGFLKPLATLDLTLLPPHETLKSMLRLHVKFCKSQRRKKCEQNAEQLRKNCSSEAPRARSNSKWVAGPPRTSSAFRMNLCPFDLISSEAEGLCSFSNWSHLSVQNMRKCHTRGEPACTCFSFPVSTSLTQPGTSGS